MATTRQLLSEYSESHQNGTNQLIHNIFVPLIYLSVLGLLWDIDLGFALGFFGDMELNAAMVVSLLGYAYYLSRSFSISLGMLLLSVSGLIGCYIIDTQTATPVWMISLCVFVGSWIMQFVGHRVEGKKPSFLKDIEFFLVGPMWVMAKLYNKLGVKY